MHFVLGIINNYDGGMNLSENVIQCFSKNEYPYSGKLIEIISTKIDKIFKENSVENDLNLIDKENTISIQSKYLTLEIKKMIEVNDISKRDYLHINEEIFQPVNFKNYWSFQELGNIQRINFIAGVYLRNFQSEKFIFYNDYEKAITTHKILTKFVEDEDSIIMTSSFLTPHTIVIETKGNGRKNIFEELKKTLPNKA